MKIELVRNNITYDVTTYASNDASIIAITQEGERGVFERVVDDVHIKLSGMTDVFYATIFGGVTQVSKILLRIFNDNNACLFLGYVAIDTVTNDLKEEWVEFDSFSATRTFWDVLGQTRVFRRLNGFNPPVFMTLQDMVQRMLAFSGVSGHAIHAGVDCGVFANRRIRAEGNDSGTIGNLGRISELNPDMTIKDLFEQCAKYYNAEFFIDPATAYWKMVARNSVLNSTEKNIDGVLLDDVIPELVESDGQRQDYIYTTGLLSNIINAPYLSGIFPTPTGQGVPPGTYRYKQTGLYNNVEVMVSDYRYVRYEATGGGADIRLVMPRSPITALVTQRHLYRYDESLPEYGYRRILTVDSINDEVVVDSLDISAWQSRPVMGSLSLFEASEWIGYDEVNSVWLDPILDIPTIVGGSAAPSGQILDVRPQIQFVTVGTNELRPYNPVEVTKFFSSDNTLDNIHAQFLEMFKTRRRGNAGVVGTNYQRGDLIVSGILGTVAGGSPNFIVKKAEIDLLKEETKLGLVTAP